MARFAETALQRAVGQYLDVLEAQRKLLWWPVPNGQFVAGADPSERGRRVAKLKSDRLLKPGAWDICILLPGGRLALLELKAGSNTLTDQQEAFGFAACKLGADTAVCWSFDEAKGQIDRWVADRQVPGAPATPLLMARAGA